MTTHTAKRPMRKVAFCSAVAIGVISSSVDGSHAQMGPKETEGTFLGAIVGGSVGSMIGGRAGVAGGIAGAVVGGMIGNRIGASLDEQDRIALAQATRAAITSGRTHRFSNRRTGVRGTVELSSQSQNSDGKLCRTVVQKVTLKDGSVVNDSVSACRGPRGWEI